MNPGFIKRYLRRRHRRLLVLGVGLTVAFNPLLTVLVGVWLVSVWGLFSLEALLAVLLFLVSLTSLAVLCLGVWSWCRLGQHPDVLALSRYGPPWQVVDAIEHELLDDARVLRFGTGHPPRRSGEPHPDHPVVLLTESWLLYLPGGAGYRMSCLHLDSIVWAGQVPAGSVQNLLGGGRLFIARIADRYGVTMRITGAEDGITRLLAEVLTRVPWALGHFDGDAERAWEDKREEIIADADRRRQEIQSAQARSGLAEG